MTKVLESLNAALHRCLATDDRVVILGEDILDPYGGAFKVTKGLSTAFPDRVWTTPVSESALVGAATGMALRGLRPVVEIMFGDFTTLIADQLINHAAKFATMYGAAAAVPMVVRTPMGGRRGYGPTHSQTIEKLYCGIPGLRVLAASAFGDPGAHLATAVLEGTGPVLFVENKVLYNTEIRPVSSPLFASVERGSAASPAAAEDLTCRQSESCGITSSPAYLVNVANGGTTSVTMVSYGYTAELAAQALVRLAYEFEVFAELVVMGQLAPFDMGPIRQSLRATGRLLTIEEGTRTLGWGTEVVARAAEDSALALRQVRRLATDDIAIPAAGPLELAVLPSVDDIVKAAVEMASA